MGNWAEINQNSAIMTTAPAEADRGAVPSKRHLAITADKRETGTHAALPVEASIMRIAVPASTLRHNYAQFEILADEAERLATCGAWNACIDAVRNAARHATAYPCGLFASDRLENCIQRISEATALAERVDDFHPPTTRPEIRRVLHVCTQVRLPGGLSKMLARWIGSDAEREHSLALTGQRRKVPQDLQQLVAGSGGKISFPGERPGGLLAVAKALRRLAGMADLVVLHIDCDDVAACLAFVDRRGLPPVTFLDHADHVFWLGTHACDLLVSLRGAGARLAEARRGIESERIAMLPILLDRRARTMSREMAKRRLGLTSDSLMLLCIARSVKFRSIASERYVDMFAPFLRSRPDAVLVIVGPGERPDWRESFADLKPQVRLYPETLDTETFLQAADIYVDSFPFVSTTSLLEGGQFENPVITRSIHPDGNTVLDSDMPGVEKTIIRVRDMPSMTSTLLSLTVDERRSAIGLRTAFGIHQTHCGNQWQAQLESVYLKAMEASHGRPSRTMASAPRFDAALDRLLPAVHGAPTTNHCATTMWTEAREGIKRRRWLAWREMSRDRSVNLARRFVPEWLTCALLRRLRS